MTKLLLGLLAGGDSLGTSCVNVAEIERGLRPKEREAAEALLTRLRFFETTREAATRARRYQAQFGRRGVAIHTADAIVAGTARAHGAILLTDDVGCGGADEFMVEGRDGGAGVAGGGEAVGVGQADRV